jgi:hypothetical protein
MDTKCFVRGHHMGFIANAHCGYDGRNAFAFFITLQLQAGILIDVT